MKVTRWPPIDVVEIPVGVINRRIEPALDKAAEIKAQGGRCAVLIVDCMHVVLTEETVRKMLDLICGDGNA